MKVTNLIPTLLTASLLTMSTSALAQPHHKAGGLFKLFDQDKNGSISASEIANASTVLQAIDIDQSGEITKDDLKAIHKERCESKAEKEGKKGCKALRKGKKQHKGKRGASLTDEQKAERFAKLDKNGDTFLDENEIKPRLLKKADKNQDSLVSLEELTELFKHKKGHKRSTEE
ncbi:EF-hand domain-containing protein [Catenovulum adriaticum]|uniref:EF-hand domain-containing protein n=1 Tax=Catenovulum adriaticum TaxID=2984846 RepID=A0ABY7ANT2_9ALTE|nr:hypothetical protein [Catenovulum sp. TS8]WAJ71218.1 hypothetical protein OLW01_05305 [Catenovulum sp. TS8]